MSYQVSTYKGDDVYNCNCTGDAVVGDEVRFERATFTGSHRSAKFAGFELVTGTIFKDSYGANKQQHTFTIQKDDGTTLRIKGRNLYANGTWRKAWVDESARHDVAAEKHERGAIARAERDARREADRDCRF